jgi:hypothetical protein
VASASTLDALIATSFWPEPNHTRKRYDPVLLGRGRHTLVTLHPNISCDIVVKNPRPNPAKSETYLLAFFSV